MHRLPDLEHAEHLRERVAYSRDQTSILEQQRSGNYDAMVYLRGSAPGSQVWVKTVAGMRLQLPVEAAKGWIQKDQERISTELKIIRQQNQELSGLLQEHCITSEDIINELKTTEEQTN